MIRALPILGLTLAAALALSCDDNYHPSSYSTVSGVFDDGTASAKALFAASAYEVIAENPVNGQSFPVTLTGRAFTTTVYGGIHLRLTVKKDDVAVLSRLLPGSVTATNPSSVTVNAVTTVQARMTAAVLAKARDDDYDAALAAVNRELFGSATVDDGALTVARIAAVPGKAALAARIAIYAQAVSNNTSSAAVVALTRDLSAAFDNVTGAAIGTKWQQAVEAVGGEAAVLYGSVFASVRTTLLPVLGESTLTTLVNEAPAAVRSAIYASVAYVPVFKNATDNVRTAAPGVLFQYTFPAATTLDHQGIRDYAGAWTAAPAGVSDTTDSGRTLRFLPAQADAGNSFTYSLTATGANGKTVTSAITLAVKSTAVAGVMRKQLAGATDSDNNGSYRPVKGPFHVDGNLYLLAQYAGNSFRLEKYKAAGVTQGADMGVLVREKRWGILPAAGAVRDMTVFGTRAYLATEAWGVVGYDLALGTAAPVYPDFPYGNSPATMSATLVCGGGERVYAMDSGNRAIASATLALAGPGAEAGLSAKAAQLSATTLRTWSSYTYLVGGNAAAVYNPAAASWFAPDLALAADTLCVSDAGDIAPPAFYLASQNTATQVGVSGGALATASIGGIGLHAATADLAGNGPWAFAMNTATTVIHGYSLKGSALSTASVDEAATGPLGYASAGGLRLAIRNVPEGISTGRSGAYIYTLGQYNSSTPTAAGSWYIKAFKAQPSE